MHQGDELFSIQSRGKQCAFRLLVYRQHTNNVRSYPTARVHSHSQHLLMPWYKETDIVHESSE